MTGSLPRPAASPCPSCPYRTDVPAGIWDAAEYGKLPAYDGETWEQSPALFLCHQRDGCLCAGWLACHGGEELLALRINAVDPTAYTYSSPVPVFTSGAAAMAHGIAGIAAPDASARRIVRGLSKKQQRIRRAR